MTNRQALAQLHAIESWLRVPLARDGRPYGPGFFARRDWVGTLKGTNRRVSFRLAQYGQCLRCHGPLAGSSTGDHMIAKACGGPHDATNYLPLCRACNASKGTRDFLEWWSFIDHGERTAAELPAAVRSDVLCSYARLMYAWLGERQRLDEPAPPALVAAVDSFKSQLPEAHWAAIAAIG